MTLIENTLITSHSDDVINQWGIINFDNEKKQRILFLNLMSGPQL